MIGQSVLELDTPALLVDLDKLARNIARMRRTIVEEAGIRWRPHVKAIRAPALVHRLLEAGATGVACATVAEAEVLAGAGIRDIMIANQVVGPTKVTGLSRLLRHADPIVAVDAEPHLAPLEAAALATATRLRVVIEVDIGMGRAGVEPGEPVVALARRVAGHPGLRLAGLMAWEGGRVASLPDPEVKRKTIEAAVGRLTDTADRCRAAGFPVDVVSCGGTGTYWITARLRGVTEVQAGGGIFGDVYYRRRCGVDHEYALTVLTTVVSRPSPTRMVCDAGWKSVGHSSVLPEPLDLGEVKSLALAAEHATIELAAPRPVPAIGDRVELVASYSDATVFLHDRLHGVRDGRVEAVWPIPHRTRA